MHVNIGVISDIHGDVATLERVFGFLDALGVERVVCAGDVVGYGPEPDEAAAELRARRVICVRGNHDRWALDRAAEVPDAFGGAGVSAETRAYLQALPPLWIGEMAGRLITMVHGVPGSDMTYLTAQEYTRADLRAMLSDLGTDVLIVGHTHLPAWYRCGTGLVVNPGSLVSSVPRLSTSRTFAVVDLGTLRPSYYSVETCERVDVAVWGVPRTRSG